MAGERRFSRAGVGGCAGGWDGDGCGDDTWGGEGCGGDTWGCDGWDVGGRGASMEQALISTAAVNATGSLLSEWSF